MFDIFCFSLTNIAVDESGLVSSTATGSWRITLQKQGDNSRPARRPVTHMGKFVLNPERDLPLLQLVRDATFISRQQIELLIADRTDESNYDNRNRRIARLVKRDQLQIYPQCFPYPGRIFAITYAGINTLQVAGMGILSVSTDTETLAEVAQVPHFIGLNEIEIAARQAFNVIQWIGDRQLKSLNIAASRPTQKDYDSIVEIAGLPDTTSPIYLGIEYERTIKSKERYAQIRKKLDGERQIHGLLYFVDNEANATLLSREVYSATVPVGVVIASQFQLSGVNAALRVVQNRSVVRTSVNDYVTSIKRLRHQSET